MKKTGFGLKLEQARKQSKLSQTALGEKLGVHQTSLASWENNKRIPPENKRLILESTLNLPVGTIDEWILEHKVQMVNEKNLPLTHVRRNGEAAWKDVHDMISTVNKYYLLPGHQVDIWIIGIENYPTILQDHHAETWLTNLASGVNYRIPWFLDLSDSQALREIMGQMQQMTASPDNLSGRVIHYPIHTYPEDRAPPFLSGQDMSRSTFISFAKWLSSWNKHLVYEPKKIDCSKPAFYNMLYHVSSLTCTVVLTISEIKDKEAPPQCSMASLLMPSLCILIIPDEEGSLFKTYRCSRANQMRINTMAFDIAWCADM